MITLILTVCLPFVFLVSSQPKAELIKEKVFFESYHDVNPVAKSTIEIVFISAEIQQNKIIEFDGQSNQKIPLEKFRVKWKSIYANHSGNKAPPVSRCFLC